MRVRVITFVIRLAARCGSMLLYPGGVETDPSEASKRFFLKKEAKTFAYWCARSGTASRV
jgi:hypothetical protein